MVDMATAGMEGMAAMVDMEAAWASTLASVRESSEESVADMAVMVSTANHLHQLRGYYQQNADTADNCKCLLTSAGTHCV